jgi:hypothetical protein
MMTSFQRHKLLKMHPEGIYFPTLERHNAIRLMRCSLFFIWTGAIFVSAWFMQVNQFEV